MHTNILVSGSVAYDRILLFKGKFKDHILPEKVHALSVSFSIDTIDESFGGAGANIVYNLSLLEENPVLLASIGNDGDKYLSYFEERGIDTSYLERIPNVLCAQAHIMTDSDNNQITGFYQGAGGHVYGKPIPHSEENIAIIAPSNHNEMVFLAEYYQKHNISYIFDPGQQTPTFSDDEYRRCVQGASYFIVNDYEMALSVEKTGWSEADIREKVPVVITTLGDNGSVIHEGGTKHIIGIAWAETVVDPTGAGDGYRAGFIKGLMHGLSTDASARLGATIASFAIEKNGTQNHTFSIKDVAERHQKAFGESLPF